MLTVKDCLVFLSLSLLGSCQEERGQIVPLFSGLTSTPGNQFTFQPQPAVPGLQTQLTSPSPPLNLQAFKAVPLAAPPTIPPAVPHPSLKEKLHVPTPPTTTPPPSPPPSPSPPTTPFPPPPPPPPTTPAPAENNLSVFGNSLPSGSLRPQSLSELPRQRQQQQPELFQQQQRQQQPRRFQTQFNQNPRQQFAPQAPPQRVVQQPPNQGRHPEEFLNRLTEEEKNKFLQQFSYLNLEQQQYAYNQFLSTPANVQQFAIKQFLSLDPEVLVFSIQTEIDSERGVQQQQPNPPPQQPQFNQQQQQQQQQQQRFNNNNQQPRQLTRADARALQQQESALNDIIALQNSLNFPSQS